MFENSSENIKMIAVPGVSSVFAFLTPTTGFIYALIIMFAFNLLCGMRADGISIVRCKNFSFSKFKNGVVELFFYFLTIEAIFSGMNMMGDDTESLIIIKTLTYIFTYVYFQNGLKNLVRAYPKNKALRMIYHIIRFEFKRALPSHIQPIIDRIEDDVEKEIN